MRPLDRSSATLATLGLTAVMCTPPGTENIGWVSRPASITGRPPLRQSLAPGRTKHRPHGPVYSVTVQRCPSTVPDAIRNGTFARIGRLRRLVGGAHGS
jgi:hypothetical protein